LHQQLQLHKEDIFVNLIEVTRDNWSYGNGVAQFAL
jgi:4-oxalocrotonate tautomerase